MATSRWRRDLEAKAQSLGCSLVLGADAGYKSGYVVVAADGSKQWVPQLTQVSQVLRGLERIYNTRKVRTIETNS